MKAYAAYEKLEYERDDMVLRLEAARNGTTCILPTNTFGQNMNIEQMQAFLEKADREIYKWAVKADSPILSLEEREKADNEYKRLKRFRDTIRKRLDMMIVAP